MVQNADWFSNALLGKDGFCLTPFVPATFARQNYGDFEHFTPSRIISTTAYAGYSVTVLTAGTLVMADTVGGWLNFVGGGAATQGIQMQSDGEMYIPAAGNDIWFEASIKLTDADDVDWFVGLASTDTNIFSTDPLDIIAFRGDDGDVNIDLQVRKAATGGQVDTTSDTADGTAVQVGFHVSGVDSVTPYINGTAGTAITTNIPIVEMALTFGMLDGATTANNILGVDWYRICQAV